MVKWFGSDKDESMKTNEARVIPPTPNLIIAMKSGFDAITNHVILIMFPLLLDLFLWFGPHLGVKNIVQVIVNQMTAIYNTPEAGPAETLQAIKDIWTFVAEHYNIFIALRSYPVGIPSLMASKLPVGVPFGVPLTWNLDTFASLVFFWIFISLIGLSAGTFYFAVVAQAALSDRVEWRETLVRWPQEVFQVILLALFWIALMIVVAIPLSCIASLSLLGGFTMLQCVILLYGGFLLWLIFPLFFSPHGIFVHQSNMMTSIKSSIRLTRMTLPTTGFFLLIAILISKGLDMLWQVPAETSWMAMIGVIGHAFVTTSLLAASFVYYRDADRWAQTLLNRVNLTSMLDVNRKM
jgi:hypothetical protein